MLLHTFFAAALSGLTAAQTPSNNYEIHPALVTWKCTVAGGCVPQNTGLVLDSVSHPIHQKDDPSKGCGTWGAPPDPAVCPDEETCAKNCILEGIQNYTEYGVTTNGGNLEMSMFNPEGTLVSPRIYLLAENRTYYEMLHLTGNELAFDVDVSRLPCGMNGALYLSEMDASGGRSALNPGGATYGTGYCDAQCFVSPWINGVVSLGIKLIRKARLTVHRATLQAAESAATKWTSGKPTVAPRRYRLIHVARTGFFSALGMNVPSTDCATRSAAWTTRICIEETEASTDWD